VATCFGNIGPTADLIGGWVCTKAGLDVVANSKSGTDNSCSNHIPVVQPIAHLLTVQSQLKIRATNKKYIIVFLVAVFL
jgi:hypothetical protein